MQARHARRSSQRTSHTVWIFLLTVIVGIPSAVLVPGVAAADTGAITSNGPLTTVTTSPDLNCTVNYAGDAQPEFFDGKACGTFVAVDGTLFGPSDVPAGSAASPRTAFTPVSQTGPTGTGTRNDPFRLVTVVDAGDSGIRLTQTDTYVTGEQSYSTVVEIANSRPTATRAIVYRAADCYLADSDTGTGQNGTDGSVACVSANGRVEGWTPLSGGSHFFEAGYSEVWARIGAQQDFPDTCRCGETVDNGAGLSWNVVVPATGRSQVAHRTAFSGANGGGDRDGDGLLDDWESQGLDVDGNGSVDLDLPAMGASPDHKDAFVEVDYMVRPNQRCVWFLCWGRHSYAPNRAAMTDVVRSFAAAPVTNPDGSAGVRLHVDAGPDSVMNPVTGQTWGERSRSNEVPYSHSLGSTSAVGYGWSDFTALKSTSFDAARADAFHYAMDLDTYGGSDSSGIAQGIPGDSFIVAKGAPLFDGAISRRQESGTFMHEFGHTLGLHHGGGLPDSGLDLQWKPNYLSVMNYYWQTGGRPIDFSRGQPADLDENALDEGSGVAGGMGPVRWFCGTSQREGAAGTPLDFNCSGGIDGGTVAASINYDGRRDVLRSHEDWSTLSYDGGAVGAFGASDINDQSPPPATTPVQEDDLATIRAAQPLGDQGDGAVTAVGPTVLFPDTTGQSVQVDVRNVGPRPADYDVRVGGLPAVATGRAAGVPPDGRTRVAVPVDASGLRPGVLELPVTITAPGGTEPLAADTLVVTVPDMSDPAVRDAARAAQAELATPQDGLDEGVRSGFLTASAAATGSGPTPSAPTGTTAVPGDRGATVSWTPPADRRGITGYVVVTTPGGAATEVAGAGTTSVRIPNLTNGTPYTFTVAARTATGVGPPSAPSAPVTPGVAPARADHVTATVTGVGRPLALRADGDAAASAFSTAVDARGAVLNLRGRASVAGDGTVYDVRVSLARRTGSYPLLGYVVVTDTRTGVQSVAVAPWPTRVNATVQPDGARVVTVTMPGFRGTGRAAQPIRIGLTVTDR